MCICVCFTNTFVCGSIVRSVVQPVLSDFFIFRFCRNQEFCGEGWHMSVACITVLPMSLFCQTVLPGSKAPDAFVDRGSLCLGGQGGLPWCKCGMFIPFVLSFCLVLQC